MAGNNTKILSAELIDILGPKSIEQEYVVFPLGTFKIDVPGYDVLVFDRDTVNFPIDAERLLLENDLIPKKYANNPELFITMSVGSSQVERHLLYRPIIPKAANIDAETELTLVATLASLHGNWHTMRQKNVTLLKRLSRVRRTKKDD